MVSRSFGLTLLARFACAPVRMRQRPPRSIGFLVPWFCCAPERMRQRPPRSFGIGFPGIIPKLFWGAASPPKNPKKS